MLRISKVLTDNRIAPIGIDNEKPRFSWKLESDKQNVVQTAYQIVVKNTHNIVWDTLKVISDQSAYIEYSGIRIEPQTQYSVSITVWDNHDEQTTGNTYFETGLMKGFGADWITHTLPENTEPCPVFKKTFNCDKKIEYARIYSTALGIYDLELNGRRVSQDYFAPGWTSYSKRLQYQAYDVTEYLADENELKATIGNGWYKGNFAFEGRANIYGSRAALILEIHLTYADGTKETISTDESWQCSTGEVLYSEIYHGETVDKNITDTGWLPVIKYDYDKSIIIAQEVEPVRITKRLPAIELIITPKGETVVDFGQNLTGFVEFVSECSKGDRITIRHAEVLDKEGNFYTTNLRTARATDRFTCSGKKEIYRPRFTFHGFRYICIEGMEGEIDISKIRACVLHTDMPETGAFECSDELINQLQQNIQWGQRGNFLDVPTDCPQRDERLGWTGDAQVFAATAAFNFDVSLFFSKWMRDLAADQGADGAVPYVIPDPLVRENGKVRSSTAWGDAAVIIPWTIYNAYGNIEILERQYKSMKAWVDYLANEAGNRYLWNTGTHFGDWLGLDMEQYYTNRRFSNNAATGATDKHYIASAFFAYSTELLIKTAEVLGKKEDAEYYKKLHKNIIDAFRKEYITKNGRLVCETQTGMLLALKFNLIEEEHRNDLVKRLVENIERHNMQMVTGFVGASYLCPVLTDSGCHEIAGKLLLQTDYPSWLYPVTKGATTIWERWNGIKPDGSFETPEMNSFNHYAYGAIGEWMYGSLLGIKAAKPGYKRITIAPKPIEGINYAKGSLDSIYGLISISWVKNNKYIKLEATVPVNCTAEVILPGKEEKITIGSGFSTFNFEV